jgi:hypothetical protein
MHKTFTNILNQNSQCIKSLHFKNKPQLYKVKMATNWRKEFANLSCNTMATAKPEHIYVSTTGNGVPAKFTS